MAVSFYQRIWRCINFYLYFVFCECISFPVSDISELLKGNRASWLALNMYMPVCVFTALKVPVIPPRC